MMGRMVGDSLSHVGGGGGNPWPAAILGIVLILIWIGVAAYRNRK